MNIVIRTGPAAQMALDELIYANAFLGMLQERIHENGHDVPEAMKTEAKAVERELAERLRGDKERQLKVLELRHEGLLTAGEKRQKVEAEIAALRQDLGLDTKTKAKGKA